jgi:methionyl-tRNA synthetase
VGVWRRQPVPPGRTLEWAGALFTKLDADALDAPAPAPRRP